MTKKPRAKNNASANPLDIPGIKRGSDIEQPSKKKTRNEPPAAVADEPFDVNADKAAEILGVSNVTVMRRADEGRLNHIKEEYGTKRKRYWFRLSDLKAFKSKSKKIFVAKAPSEKEGGPEPADVASNVMVTEVAKDHPHLFAGWEPYEWRELYSIHGIGGPLTYEGAIEMANHINWKRQVHRELDIVLSTSHGKILAGVIRQYYEQLTKRSGD